jgi:DNA-binding transcriptional LysR family regulator
MQVFMAVVDEQSLSAAAVRVGVSLPTVSRVLRGLERDLGVRLIARTTRGLTETDSGRLFYERCRTILEEMREAEAAVQAHARAPAGELRVTAPVTFGRHHVAPCLAAFLERYPKLSFCLSLSDQCELLSEQRYDIAIRVAALREPAMTVRRLGYIQRAVVGSRDYFARYPLPRHPQELTKHICLHYTHFMPTDEWRFREGERTLRVHVTARMRANNQEVLVEAVRSGVGLAVLPTWLVQEGLDSGELRRVLAEFEAPRTPVHAIFATHGAPSRKARSFVDFLAGHFKSRDILSSGSL